MILAKIKNFESADKLFTDQTTNDPLSRISNEIPCILADKGAAKLWDPNNEV